MILNPYFNYEVSISTEHYDHKPNKNNGEYNMHFHPATLTTNQLLDFIKGGYAYCHIFNGNDRKQKNFRYANLVSIDVDNSTIPMQEYLDALKFKPTYAYTTASNGIAGYGFRYRLGYVFDSKITKEYFEPLYKSILSSNSISYDKNDDNCGRTYNQLMNGNPLTNIQTYQSDYVYSLSDFMSYDASAYEESVAMIDLINQNTKVQNATLQVYNTIPTPQYISNDANWTNGKNRAINYARYKLKNYKYGSDDKINNLLQDAQKILIDYFKMTEKQFLYNYISINHYCLFQETELKYNEDGYHKFDDEEEYYRLHINYARDDDGKLYIRKYKNGEHRRKRLYRDAMLIRNINHNISFGEFLVSMIYRKQHQYEDDDGGLTKEVMLDLIIKVWCMPIQDCYCNNSDHSKITTDKVFCLVNGLNRKAYSRTCMKMERWNEIGEWYDCSRSVAENFKIGKEQYQYKGSRRTLERFCNEMRIDTNPNHKDIKEWYDEDATPAENFKWAKDNNIDVSRSLVYGYAKKLKKSKKVPE